MLCMLLYTEKVLTSPLYIIGICNETDEYW